MATSRTGVIVYTCDERRSTSSFKLVGVFTTQERLKSAINTLVANDTVEKTTKEFVGNMTVKEMQDKIKYLHLVEINFNEVQ